MSAVKVIRHQIMWNRLIAVVEEQARTMVRAAFSPAVREGGDLSAGVFDRQGRMLAQAVTGTPGHVNTMATAVRHFLSSYPIDEMAPGDVYITNDPWLASGHLHDVTIVSPAFYKGRAVGLFAATVHVVDVGGRGMGPDGNDVFEEGVLIPIMPLVRKGELNADLLTIMLANSREPFQVRGDILAIIAAGHEGARRLSGMLEEFEIVGLEELAEMIISQTRAATLTALSNLQRGEFESTMTIDGYDSPVVLKARLTVREEGLHLDFAGSSPQSSKGINVAATYTAAYSTYGMLCAAAPQIPNNYGSMSCFEVVAPEGTIVNALRPAPVSARHIIGHALPDVVFGCLEQCLDRGCPAESGMMWNPYLRGERRRSSGVAPWELFLFNAGGTGGRPGQDGLSATAFPSGIKNIPVEAAEAVAPIRFYRKELREDSGGPGRYRGGLGQHVEIGASDGSDLRFQGMFDRVDNPAGGRQGGREGLAGQVHLDDGTRLRAKGLQSIPAGRRLVLGLPGGGGYGDPRARDRQAISDDIADGYVTRESAQEFYGYQDE
ncbi:hydantoinase B/oxoprolinase family protein [Pseudohoeflea coraliihabitans]|uniref:Hydantoinase B/oxoprolinase family protein n=1 Tax=Pseudohoeflea coraliihabitans TaxID=2860393 RepID=A0ABS6WMJ2_9HYPH|nr:hydantoinase B/oxoprolinase family protein [Pseudohoeflea sp. DP4N28-3]MBW3097168.1 hydantoinase B/oxoprolinase family protein [Pseudohoeflea sp. DP4N28-3]